MEGVFGMETRYRCIGEGNGFSEVMDYVQSITGQLIDGDIFSVLRMRVTVMPSAEIQPNRGSLPHLLPRELPLIDCLHAQHSIAAAMICELQPCNFPCLSVGYAS